MTQNLKEASRKNWISRSDTPTERELLLGATMRIADATEAMSKRYADMEMSRDYWRKRCDDSERVSHSRFRSIISLRAAGKRARAERDNALAKLENLIHIAMHHEISDLVAAILKIQEGK
jgi:NMD protein affecting ribosome stability and mRNA decay